MLDVQGARLPIETNASPIVEAIRRVRRLLNFEEEEPAADRVNGPGRRVDDVAGAYAHFAEQRFGATRAARRLEGPTSDAPPQTEDDPRAAVGAKDHPRLRFPAPAAVMHVCDPVVRVNLQREIFPRVDPLHEERERPPATENRAKAASRVLAGGNDARNVADVRDLPRFADAFSRGERTPEFRRETPPSPNPLDGNRVNAKDARRRRAGRRCEVRHGSAGRALRGDRTGRRRFG